MNFSPFFWLSKETQFQSPFSHFHVLRYQKREDEGQTRWLDYPTAMTVRVKRMANRGGEAMQPPCFTLLQRQHGVAKGNPCSQCCAGITRADECGNLRGLVFPGGAHLWAMPHVL